MRRSKNDAIVVPRDWMQKRAVRGEAQSLLRKGVLKRASCQVCYNKITKMTHIDYYSPMNVIWLCQKHYLSFQNERRKERRFEKMHANSPVAPIS